MRRQFFRCFAVATAVIGSAAAAHAQSTTSSTPDSTQQMTDSTIHAKHHKNKKMTSNGSVSSTTNQSQSGMTDSSGKSTLGSKMKKVTPTQGQPVTAKGDTLRGNNSKMSPGTTPTDSSPAGTSNTGQMRDTSASTPATPPK